jgi:hypothetical protein
VFDAGALAEQRLGGVGVFPEALAQRLMIQTVELAAQSVDVKDTSPAPSDAERDR